MTDYSKAEDAVINEIWKLEAMADMFSAMSNCKGAELCCESCHGIAPLIREQAESIKESLDVLSAYIRRIKDA